MKYRIELLLALVSLPIVMLGEEGDKVHNKLLEYGRYVIKYDGLDDSYFIYCKTGFHYITKDDGYLESPIIVRRAGFGSNLGVQIINYGPNGHLPLWYVNSTLIRNDLSGYSIFLDGDNESTMKRINIKVQLLGDVNDEKFTKYPYPTKIVNSFIVVKNTPPNK